MKPQQFLPHLGLTGEIAVLVAQLVLAQVVRESWIGVVTQQMPHLSKPQAKVLAMWSFGIGIT